MQSPQATPGFLEIDPDDLPIFLPGQEDDQAAHSFLAKNWLGVTTFARTWGLRGLHVQLASNPWDRGKPSAVFHHEGQEWRGQPLPAELLENAAEFLTDPAMFLLQVTLPHGIRVLVVASLDHPPSGVSLAGGDRAKECEPEELRSQLGDWRSNLLDSMAEQARCSYKQAVAQGCQQPVILLLDLSDRYARAVSHQFFPGTDPKKALSKARREGGSCATCLATSAQSVGRAIAGFSRATAQQVQVRPPAGRTWCVIVSRGRTVVVGFDVST